MLRSQLFPACMLLGTPLLVSTSVAAQEPLEQVVVVGSRIPQPQNQAVGLTVISSEQIEQRGYATVQQVLDDLAHNAGGGFDQQLNFGFTPSASAVNLRDLGPGRTLVLIDGRRMPSFPIGFNGTDSFYDLSSIPTGAVERIEVLSDGASAIYGSDAMSGVINVVLKKQVGTEVALRYGNTVHGGGAEQRVQVSTGSNTETSKALLFLEYYHRDVLKFSQRKITESDRFGGVDGDGPGSFSIYGFPGTFTNWGVLSDPFFAYPSPTCDTSGGSPGSDSGFCEFNRASYRQVWPDSSSLSATARFEQQLTEGLQWFTSLHLRSALTRMQTEPIAYDSLFDSPDIDNPVVVAASAPNNPSDFDGGFVRRLVEFGPQRYDYDVSAYSALTGLKGEFGRGYTWELGVQSARQRVTETDRARVLKDQMGEAVLGNLDLDGNGVNDAPLDLFSVIPPNTVRALSHDLESVANSTLNSADVQLAGPLFSLPGGDAKFATVFEYTKEIYDDQRNAEILAGNVIGLGGSSGFGERARYAAGMELVLPLLTQLKVQIAGRYDKYQDDSEVGGAFSPRMAVEFRPLHSLVLRASAGRSFRAPDLPRMFGGDVVGFQTLIDTPECIANGGSGVGDASVSSCVTPIQDVLTVTRANIKLKEERGRSYNVGARWQPVTSFSASIDWFRNRLTDLVNTPDLQYMLNQNALNGSFADDIVRDCSSAGNAGCLFAIDTRAQNVAYKQVTGLDIAADYAFDISGLGRFTVEMSGSYLLDLEMKESVFRAPVDVLREGKLGEAARVKGGLQLGWRRGVWGGNVFVNHIGSFTPLSTAVIDEVGSFTTVNLSMNHELPWKGELQLGVNNVLDRQPPVDKQNGDASFTFYQQQFHDVDGAKWYAGYRQPF